MVGPETWRWSWLAGSRDRGGRRKAPGLPRFVPGDHLPVIIKTRVGADASLGSDCDKWIRQMNAWARPAAENT